MHAKTTTGHLQARTFTFAKDLWPSIETCQARIMLGDALRATGDVDAALVSYRAAAEELGTLSAGRSAAECWRALGDRLLRDADAVDAAGAYRRALDQAGVRPSVASLDRVVDVLG